MKAILFCNYGTSIVEGKIKPKLSKFGVELLRTVNVDKSGYVDVSRADAVIFMTDLMSEGQRKKIKTIARNGNKRLISLQLQGTDWSKALGQAAPEVGEVSRAVADGMRVTPPSHLRSVPPAPVSDKALEEEREKVSMSLPEDRALLNEFEAENQRLEEEARMLRRELQALEERLADELSRTPDTASVHLAHADQISELNEHIEGLEQELIQLRHDKRVSEEKLAMREKQASLPAREVGAAHALRRELETLRTQNRNQEEELVRLRAGKPITPPSAPLKTTQDFLAVRDAFKSLWRAGAMTGEEILEKLMAWGPKD